MSVEAIPTVYGGVKFRSRLEARYASAFDKLSIGWTYEKEYFKVIDEWYLPDFHFPSIRTFFEVKGSGVPGIWKPMALQRISEERQVERIGPRGPLEEQPEDTAWNDPDVLFISGNEGGVLKIAGYEDEPARIVQCLVCSEVFFVSPVRSWRCRACGAYRGDQLGIWGERIDLPRLP